MTLALSQANKLISVIYTENGGNILSQIPKVRKLYKIMNLYFIQLQKTFNKEADLFQFFTKVYIQRNKWIDEINWAIECLETTKITVRGVELNFYKLKQTTSWHKTNSQLEEFHRNYKKYFSCILSTILVKKNLAVDLIIEDICSYLF